MPGMLQAPDLQEIKLHLPNTEGKSGDTISSAAHVAFSEEDIFSVLICPRTQTGSRKSCDCLGSYEKSINGSFAFCCCVLRRYLANVLRECFLQWRRLETVLDKETTLACEKGESFQGMWSRNTPTEVKTWWPGHFSEILSWNGMWDLPILTSFPSQELGFSCSPWANHPRTEI